MLNPKIDAVVAPLCEKEIIMFRLFASYAGMEMMQTMMQSPMDRAMPPTGGN